MDELLRCLLLGAFVLLPLNVLVALINPATRGEIWCDDEGNRAKQIGGVGCGLTSLVLAAPTALVMWLGGSRDGIVVSTVQIALPIVVVGFLVAVPVVRHRLRKEQADGERATARPEPRVGTTRQTREPEPTRAHSPQRGGRPSRWRVARTGRGGSRCVGCFPSRCRRAWRSW